jgi:hypothetical protein
MTPKAKNAEVRSKTKAAHAARLAYDDQSERRAFENQSFPIKYAVTAPVTPKTAVALVCQGYVM